jgi:lysophospholipase L1-like esterase
LPLKASIFVLFLSFSLSGNIVNAQQHQSSSIFKNGDTICFVGNSITHAGQYHEFIQLFYATRFPNTKLKIINSGISGDNANNILERLDTDVLVNHPDHVFLMTGMNDVVRTLYFDGEASENIIKKRERALENYRVNTFKLVQQFKDHNINTILLTPSVYDQFSKIERENNLGCNDALEVCGTHLKHLSKKYKLPLIDLNKNMKSIMNKGLLKDSLFTIVGKDRVHPGVEGHFIMASEILTALEPKSLVSKIVIDAAEKHVKTQNNCEVNLKRIDNEFLIFDCKEFALPFPIPKTVASILDYTNFENHFNKQQFKVNHLKKGVYRLIIDNELIGSFSTRQLSQGVNLNTYKNTPQYQQAQEVKQLCETYRKVAFKLRVIPFIETRFLRDFDGNKLYDNLTLHLENKLKDIAGKPFYNYMQKSMERYLETLPNKISLENQLKTIQDAIYVKNKPIQHEWTIVKIE